MDAIDPVTLRQAARSLLRPIASLVLKCGMTWKEFAELSRAVFVEVAGRDYGIKGRPTNVARIAILTGIGRREVGIIRRALTAHASDVPDKTTDATRLLSGWHQDRDFLDGSGKPLDLPVAGPGPSFDELARRYAADVPASAMLKELRRVGAIADRPDGGLRVARRYYQPAQFDPQWILNAGSAFADLGANINHNLGAGQADRSWFLGRATDDSIDAGAVPAFQAFLEEQGQQFLERVDDWLTRHRTERRVGPNRVRLGVGLFMIKSNPEKGQDHDSK